MKRSLLWLAIPVAVFALSACEAPVEEDTTSTGGTATTAAGVEIALGTGSGSSFTEGEMTAAAGVTTNLSAGGTTTVTVNLVDVGSSNNLYSGVPVTVTFDSECVSSGKATFTNDTVITSTGTATTSYQAEGCFGTDTITAIFDTATASVQITVSPADVNSIGFTGEGFSTSISYSNSGNASQSNFSVVQFALIDNRGNPVEGQSVSFVLSSPDLENAVTLSNVAAISDESGLVETIVNAGTAAANFRVIATFTPTVGSPISTVSLPIAVNTGPADFDSFTLAISSAAVKGAYNTDGVTAVMSVQVADRHNNPVADGTVVSFWAEYGQIQSNCVTSDGSCNVNWRSGGVRPIDGLATIIAYTTGEDSFLDANERNGIYNVSGDGAATANEAIISTSEMYYDRNLDGYTAGIYVDAGSGLTVNGDAYVDYNGNGSYEASSALYRGELCSVGAVAAGHCAETSVQVWDLSQIAMNTITPLATVQAGPWSAGNTYTVVVTDSLGNYPPVGTGISITATGLADATTNIYGTVPAVGFAGNSGFTFSVYVDTMTVAGTHRIEVSFTGGNTVYYNITIN